MDSKVIKPILIIKTGNTITELRTSGADFEDWFCQGLAVTRQESIVCSIHQSEPLPPLASISGIVISGSAAYVTDLADWNYIAAQYIRRAHNMGLPILGVCYGHQLIAWAFGGRVDFNPAGRQIGTVTVELEQAAESDTLFVGASRRFKANASHLQSVIQLPPEAVRLARNELDSNHGFRLGPTTWGLQFHPEFSGDITRAYIDARRAVINGEGLSAEGLYAGVEDTPEAASLLSKFKAVVVQKAAS